MPPSTPRPARGCLGVLVALLCAIAPAVASAQTFERVEAGGTPGWVFTPTFVFSVAHDDNVTLAGHNAPTASDTLAIFTPSGDLQYRGRHNWVDLGYVGSWSLYKQLNDLNTFDQTARIDTKHDLSRRVALLLHDSLALHPTTDVVGLLGVPFVRIGSTMNDARAEVRVQATPRTTASLSYALEYVSFDQNEQFARFLRGGTAHAGSGRVEHQVSRRLAVGGEYTFRRALIADNGGRFDMQDGAGTVAYQATENLRLSGAFGFARLDNARDQTSRTGPSWRLGAEQRLERATVSGSYVRSYVPSFGLGGSLQNEELTVNLHMPLSRNRVYWQASLAWRRNEPLTAGEQKLKSLWFQTWVGYSIQRWLRLEGYIWRSQQDSQFAGGRVDRNRIGVQLVTAMPMRIR